MATASKSNTTAIFELKSASLTLISFVLKTASLAELSAELEARFASTPGLFEHDPVVIDLTPVRDSAVAIDFVKLLKLLRKRKMVPVAVRGGSAGQMAAALEAGLAEAPETSPTPSRGSIEPVPESAAVDVPVETPVDVAITSPAETESAPASAPAPAPASASASASASVATLASPVPTVVVDRPLRSGQQVYARGADLVVMAAVSFGAEVIADGNIHVYAPLRGRAVAGARGNTQARIFTTCMEAQLISIAGTYRTTDTDLPADVKGKPAQVRLDGETLVIEPLAG